MFQLQFNSRQTEFLSESSTYIEKEDRIGSISAVMLLEDRFNHYLTFYIISNEICVSNNQITFIIKQCSFSFLPSAMTTTFHAYIKFRQEMLMKYRMYSEYTFTNYFSISQQLSGSETRVNASQTTIICRTRIKSLQIL